MRGVYAWREMRFNLIISKWDIYINSNLHDPPKSQPATETLRLKISSHDIPPIWSRKPLHGVKE